MMRARTAALTLTLALTATLAAGQSSPPAGRQRAAPAWNPGTVTTIKGTISQSREVGRAEVVALVIKTDAGSQTVLLGPETALDPTVVKLAQGTEVEITGSKVKVTRQQREQEVILASLVKTGGKEYRIRNEQGQLVDKDGKLLPQPRR